MKRKWKFQLSQLIFKSKLSIAHDDLTSSKSIAIDRTINSVLMY